MTSAEEANIAKSTVQVKLTWKRTTAPSAPQYATMPEIISCYILNVHDKIQIFT